MELSLEKRVIAKFLSIYMDTCSLQAVIRLFPCRYAGRGISGSNGYLEKTYACGQLFETDISVSLASICQVCFFFKKK